MQANKKSAKKPKPSYLLPIIFVGAMILWSFVPLLPLLVKAVVPFPRLEDATYFEGIFDYEGEWPHVHLPKYYVVNAEGRHEFSCGYLGGRHTCFSKPITFKGQPIKLWSSFWYGRIQHEVVPRAGERPHPFDGTIRPYESSVTTYLDPRYVQKSVFSMFTPIVLSLFMGCLIVLEVWRRQELKEQNNQQSKPQGELK